MIEYLFEIDTVLDFTVRTTKIYWDKICLKHPELIEQLEIHY